MILLVTFSDEGLFSKGIYNWTGNSILGAYVISATVSHYDWTKKKIKAHIKIYIQ